MNKHRTRCFCQQRNPNEVKNRKEFFGEEIRNDSKIRWKIVANAASLKRYEWIFGDVRFSALFPCDLRAETFRRSSERTCYRACCTKTREPGKWKHWHGGNEKMIVISGEWGRISREITNWTRDRKGSVFESGRILAKGFFPRLLFLAYFLARPLSEIEKSIQPNEDWIQIKFL